MTGFEPATSFDTGPQLPAPLTTWNTCVDRSLEFFSAPRRLQDLSVHFTLPPFEENGHGMPTLCYLFLARLPQTFAPHTNFPFHRLFCPLSYAHDNYLTLPSLRTRLRLA